MNAGVLKETSKYMNGILVYVCNMTSLLCIIICEADITCNESDLHVM